jgi:hypothetical protein
MLCPGHASHKEQELHRQSRNYSTVKVATDKGLWHSILCLLFVPVQTELYLELSNSETNPAADSEHLILRRLPRPSQLRSISDVTESP